MIQKGYVTEVGEGYVKVRVERQSACGGNCASCLGCPSDAKIVKCPCRGTVVKGDTVELVMDGGRFFKNIFWGYILPTVLTVAGAAAGYILTKKEGASVLGAGLGLAAGLALDRIIFRRKETEIVAVPTDR